MKQGYLVRVYRGFSEGRTEQRFKTEKAARAFKNKMQKEASVYRVELYSFERVIIQKECELT